MFNSFLSLSLIFIITSSCRKNESNIITSKGNLGSNINTPYNEFFPCMIDSLTLVYSSDKPIPIVKGLSNQLANNNIPHLYLSIFSEAEWEFSLSYQPSFNEDNLLQQLFFSNCDNIYCLGTKLKLNTNSLSNYQSNKQNSKLFSNEKDCDLVIINKNNFKEMSHEINSPYWDSQVTLSNDCKNIYFSSDRDKGLGGSDIWRVLIENNKFSEPENVKFINSEFDELSPYFDDVNDRLYFARKELNSGLDIYYYDFGKKIIIKLPQPYNSEKDDFTPYIFGGKMYLSSNRDGSCGGFDLYSFDKPK